VHSSIWSRLGSHGGRFDCAPAPGPAARFQEGPSLPGQGVSESRNAVARLPAPFRPPRTWRCGRGVALLPRKLDNRLHAQVSVGGTGNLSTALDAMAIGPAACRRGRGASPPRPRRGPPPALDRPVSFEMVFRHRRTSGEGTTAAPHDFFLPAAHHRVSTPARPRTSASGGTESAKSSTWRPAPRRAATRGGLEHCEESRTFRLRLRNPLETLAARWPADRPDVLRGRPFSGRHRTNPLRAAADLLGPGDERSTSRTSNTSIDRQRHGPESTSFMLQSDWQPKPSRSPSPAGVQIVERSSCPQRLPSIRSGRRVRPPESGGSPTPALRSASGRGSLTSFPRIAPRAPRRHSRCLPQHACLRH